MNMPTIIVAIVSALSVGAVIGFFACALVVASSCDERYD